MSCPEQWYALPVLSGRLIRLEPLALEHAPGYLAAAGSAADAEEVFRWTKYVPAGPDGARAHILDALAARARGERFPYVQLDAVTGEVAGTTSYYDVAPSVRAIAIGHTWLGRRWWRTGHNTESKLLLLTHAFETLGAARVVWHTDSLNTRSQAAIERLGAQREGLLRKHRIRPSGGPPASRTGGPPFGGVAGGGGSWRDTVQYAMTDDDWPAARDRLRARLDRG